MTFCTKEGTVALNAAQEVNRLIQTLGDLKKQMHDLRTDHRVEMDAQVHERKSWQQQYEEEKKEQRQALQQLRQQQYEKPEQDVSFDKSSVGGWRSPQFQQQRSPLNGRAQRSPQRTEGYSTDEDEYERNLFKTEGYPHSPRPGGGLLGGDGAMQPKQEMLFLMSPSAEQQKAVIVVGVRVGVGDAPRPDRAAELPRKWLAQLPDLLKYERGLLAAEGQAAHILEALVDKSARDQQARVKEKEQGAEMVLQLGYRPGFHPRSPLGRICERPGDESPRDSSSMSEGEISPTLTAAAVSKHNDSERMGGGGAVISPLTTAAVDQLNSNRESEKDGKRACQDWMLLECCEESRGRSGTTGTMLTEADEYERNLYNGASATQGRVGGPVGTRAERNRIRRERNISSSTVQSAMTDDEEYRGNIYAGKNLPLAKSAKVANVSGAVMTEEEEYGRNQFRRERNVSSSTVQSAMTDDEEYRGNIYAGKNLPLTKSAKAVSITEQGNSGGGDYFQTPLASTRTRSDTVNTVMTEDDEYARNMYRGGGDLQTPDVGTRARSDTVNTVMTDDEEYRGNIYAGGNLPLAKSAKGVRIADLFTPPVGTRTRSDTVNTVMTEDDEYDRNMYIPPPPTSSPGHSTGRAATGRYSGFGPAQFTGVGVPDAADAAATPAGGRVDMLSNARAMLEKMKAQSPKASAKSAVQDNGGEEGGTAGGKGSGHESTPTRRMTTDAGFGIEEGKREDESEAEEDEEDDSDGEFVLIDDAPRKLSVKHAIKSIEKKQKKLAHSVSPRSRLETSLSPGTRSPLRKSISEQVDGTAGGGSKDTLPKTKSKAVVKIAEQPTGQVQPGKTASKAQIATKAEATKKGKAGSRPMLSAGIGGLFGSRQRSFTHSSSASPRTDPESPQLAESSTKAESSRKGALTKGGAQAQGGVGGVGAAAGAAGNRAAAGAAAGATEGAVAGAGSVDDAILRMLQKDEHVSVKVALQALKKARPEWKKLKKGEVGNALVRARGVLHAAEKLKGKVGR
jgi:hypothetical protein